MRHGCTRGSSIEATVTIHTTHKLSAPVCAWLLARVGAGVCGGTGVLVGVACWLRWVWCPCLCPAVLPGMPLWLLPCNTHMLPEGVLCLWCTAFLKNVAACCRQLQPRPIIAHNHRCTACQAWQHDLHSDNFAAAEHRCCF